MDLINIAETKINPTLLSRESEFKDNPFHSDVNYTIFINNFNKLLSIRQQGGVLSSVRADLAKFCIGLGSNLLNLGR